MMTRIKQMAKAMQSDRHARRIFRATRHLDAHILRDIGLSHDALHARAYPL